MSNLNKSFKTPHFNNPEIFGAWFSGTYKIHRRKSILFIIFIGIVLFLINPLAILILPAFIFAIRSAIKHRNFMKKFALNHGLTYQNSFVVKSLKGRLFSRSNNESVSSVLIGKHADHPIKIFNYYYTIGSGKNSHTYKFTVCEIEIDKTMFPYILLLSKSMPHYGRYNLKFNNSDVKISLENEFAKTYSLYTKEDYEIEVLQIFTKSFLHFLKETGSHFSIEFSDNKIYIYDDKIIKKESDLNILLDLTKKVVEKSGPLLKRLHDDFDSLHHVYKK